MQVSVVYWLSANYRASGAAVAMDASPAVMMRNAMQKLAKRWTRRFDDMAQKLADRFANDAMKNADASLATAFKDAGFTVELKMTSQMNNALQATIAENVGLECVDIAKDEGDKKEPFRILDRRLQALRKLGVIAHVKGKGWVKL